MLNRALTPLLLKALEEREISLVTGPRRVGKTTLLHTIEKHAQTSLPTLYVDFTDPASVTLWADFSIEKITRLLNAIGSELLKKVIFFDEIQYLPKGEKLLKLLYDHFPMVKVFATGSSSFLLMQSIGESLAGRKKIFTLLPISLGEFNDFTVDDFWVFKEHLLDAGKFTQQIKELSVFGSYPDIVLMSKPEEKIEKLRDISESVLFKDLLMFEHIKKPRILVELTKLLAIQIGSLVNPNELAENLGVSRGTILDYIDLLEKFFIIQRVYPYEKNMRDVIRKKFKVYFIDTGIRNAVIGDFRNIEQRSDRGHLLENLVAMGLWRQINYGRKLTEIYFWQDYAGKEVDLLLKDQEIFRAIEVKWQINNRRLSKSFLKYFPKAETFLVDHQNAYRFCL